MVGYHMGQIGECTEWSVTVPGDCKVYRNGHFCEHGIERNVMDPDLTNAFFVLSTTVQSIYYISKYYELT